MPVYACGSDKFAQHQKGKKKGKEFRVPNGIEEQLEELFPQARIARMDIDSVRGKQAQMITQYNHFEQSRLDILVEHPNGSKGD